MEQKFIGGSRHDSFFPSNPEIHVFFSVFRGGSHTERSLAFADWDGSRLVDVILGNTLLCQAMP